MDFVSLNQIANFVPIGGENMGKFPKFFTHRKEIAKPIPTTFWIPGDWSKTLKRNIFLMRMRLFFGLVEG